MSPFSRATHAGGDAQHEKTGQPPGGRKESQRGQGSNCLYEKGHRSANRGVSETDLSTSFSRVLFQDFANELRVDLKRRFRERANDGW
jgi:hypothetical protein